MKRAMKADDAPEDLTTLRYPVLVSPKLDGIGCVVMGGVALSRKMKPIPNKFIQSILRALPDGMHGELIVGDAKRDDSWNDAQSGVMSRDGKPMFVFHVFDWWHPTFVPFRDRHFRLRQWMMHNGTDFYRYVQHTQCDNAAEVETRYREFRRMKYEGLMIRDPNGPYKEGRSTQREGFLLKMKPSPDSEAKVIGYEEQLANKNEQTVAEDGRKKRAKRKENMVPKNTLGAIIAEDMKTGVQFKVGTGFDDNTRRVIWRSQGRFLGRAFTYSYQSLTKNGLPRHAVWKGWRRD